MAQDGEITFEFDPSEPLTGRLEIHAMASRTHWGEITIGD
jgi:hypothetical protein